MKFLEVKMRNLNEPLKRGPEDLKPEQPNVDVERPANPQVVSMEDRQPKFEKKFDGGQSLISKREMEDLRSRWSTVQGSFVDEPRKAVKDADELVSAAIKQMSENFRNQRAQLEKQWSSGSEVNTEDLRVCLQQYRTFFERLLSI